MGLNNDIEGHSTINNNQLNSEESEKHIEYDAILHYIKMASTLKMTNVNNNADSNAEQEDTKTKDTTPSQVNYPSTSKNTPYNTQLTSISSDNLACKVPFKSFENIQQSHKRYHTNSHNEIPGTSSDPNVNLISKNSNELLDEFNTKTNEITKGLHELHFSTIDLRNKLSKGRVNNNHPIIIQVTRRNNMTASTTTQVRVDIYPPGQSCWHEIRGFLHMEMNLQIKAAYYDVLNKNEIYPLDHSVPAPPNLISNQRQADTILTLRKNQAKEMLNTLSIMSTHEANKCRAIFTKIGLSYN